MFNLPKQNNKGRVVWFTGLSGSGKSTIANLLAERLVATKKRVKILDGDNIRSAKHRDLSFSREDIRKNNLRVAEMAKKSQTEFDFILVPIISPYREDRDKVKEIIGENFTELFVNTPLEECIKRDVKGLYKKAERGEISNLIGFHDSNPYEPPLNPDIKIDTAGKTAEQSVEVISQFLSEKRSVR